MFGSHRSKNDELKAKWGQPRFINRNFFQIARYHAEKEHANNGYVISDRTRTALNFADLFSFLDRTASRVGQQWLYNRLSCYERDEKVSDLEEMIAYWEHHPEERLRAQVTLSRLNHDHAYGICTLFLDSLPKSPSFLPLVRWQALLSVVILAFTILYVKLLPLLVIWLGINSLVHYYCKGFIQHFAFSLDQLSIMNRVADDISAIPFPNSDKNKVSPAIKSLREVCNLWSLFGDGSGGRDIADLGWLVREYLKIIFLIEPVMFFRALSKLRNDTAAVQTVFEYVGLVDGSISILSVRQSSVWCIPQHLRSGKGSLVAENMIHPLIEGCVANSVDMVDHSLLITGSNMSGKSAFIRSVAINVLCAHTINTCFANRFSSTFLKLHAVMNVSDDLVQGKSYYMEEVISIHEMLTCSMNETQCLFLMDEIFRGTNTTERVAAASSVLSFLSKNNVVIAATHDGELTVLLERDFEMFHFSETISGETLSFDYVLKKGKLRHGNAIRILELSGYPTEVVEAARRAVARPG